MDNLVAENYLDHNPPPFPGLQPGLAGDSSKYFWRPRPAITESTTQIAEGDKVVTRLTAIGTHEGEMFGIAPNGKKLEMTAIVIHRIANGKLVE